MRLCPRFRCGTGSCKRNPAAAKPQGSAHVWWKAAGAGLAGGDTGGAISGVPAVVTGSLAPPPSHGHWAESPSRPHASFSLGGEGISHGRGAPAPPGTSQCPCSSPSPRTPARLPGKDGSQPSNVPQVPAKQGLDAAPASQSHPKSRDTNRNNEKVEAWGFPPSRKDQKRQRQRSAAPKRRWLSATPSTSAHNLQGLFYQICGSGSRPATQAAS